MGGSDLGELYLGGFSSSGLGKRNSLTLEQGLGIYITDARLLAIRNRSSRESGGNINVIEAPGIIKPKVEPFFDADARTIIQLDKSEILLEMGTGEISQIDLDPPGDFHKGRILITDKSGLEFELLLMDGTEDYGPECFKAARELMERALPDVVITG